MVNLIRNALKKFDKLTYEQLREILNSAANELETFREVLASLVKGLLVCDTRHTLILTNPHAERLLHIPTWIEGGDVVWALVSNREISNFLQETLNMGYRIDDKEFPVDEKGVRRLLSVSVLPLVDRGHVTGSLITVEDITEKRLNEVKLRQVENLAGLTTVAAGVAHEIKNPLGSLSIHVQLIQKLLNNAVKNIEAGASALNMAEANTDNVSVSYTKFNKHITTVNEEIQRLNKIVVDFLFAIRPMEILPAKSDINKLIKDIVKFVHYELKNADIKYKLQMKEDIPIIEIDKRYIKQALLNLIKNSIEAMSGSGGFLTISTESDEQEVTIRIRDTGPGIQEADKARIFEPYFTTKIKGSGLGLTLVFKIIREHSGEIEVDSKVGEGACFTIKLPLPYRDGLLLSYAGYI
ncbi:MAG: PAS domain-containing sensor histidine kinase [Spirochaetaceae bacterium]|jgi:signal transduction histidine kinase|nr:PAS domain-containing sensor histidine kinase [Spirochaetaceae bacterium]